MNAAQDRIAQFLYAEAMALDERRWEDWLALFTGDCEYWVPAWKSEDELTADPHAELSLVYYSERSGLEDRVWRVRSGRSAASIVMPRTQHAVSNVSVLPKQDGLVPGRCNWMVHQFLPKERELQVFFGRCEYALVEHEDSWRIRRKKIILLNDIVPAKLDFYSL